VVRHFVVLAALLVPSACGPKVPHDGIGSSGSGDDIDDADDAQADSATDASSVSITITTTASTSDGSGAGTATTDWPTNPDGDTDTDTDWGPPTTTVDTVSTTDDGGTEGRGSCGFAPNDPACETCLEDACCPAVLACAADVDCDCILSCFEALGDNGQLIPCLTVCELTTTPDPLSPLLDCMTASCPVCL
jgi:hypothetical protein